MQPRISAAPCVEPNPSDSYAGCSFDLDETSGRLATGKTVFDQRLGVEMVFEHDSFIHLRTA